MASSSATGAELRLILSPRDRLVPFIALPRWDRWAHSKWANRCSYEDGFYWVQSGPCSQTHSAPSSLPPTSAKACLPCARCPSMNSNEIFEPTSKVALPRNLERPDDRQSS